MLLETEKNMKELGASRLLVCPTCRGALSFSASGAACQQCGRNYPRHPAGFLDLRPDDSHYQDWISGSDAASERWLAGDALTESVGAQHMMRSYLAPLLGKLNLAGGTVLSVGCGGGWDVDELQAAGFSAWGIDNGGRTVVWPDRTAREQLVVGDALRMPFADAGFDFVFSEGVIEHIGMNGDSFEAQSDHQEQRVRYVDSQLRVTKPGGYVLVACPNGRFPIDFFHGGRVVQGVRMRFHRPGEQFLPSCEEIRRLFSSQAEWVRPLTLHGFFNLDRLAGESRFAALSSRMMKAASRLLPAAFLGTALSPYLVILIRKRSLESA